MSTETVTPAQCRAARAMIEWSRKRLAEGAGIAERTLIDFERGARTPLRNNLRAIRRALEAAGVEFAPDGGVRARARGEGG